MKEGWPPPTRKYLSCAVPSCVLKIQVLCLNLSRTAKSTDSAGAEAWPLLLQPAQYLLVSTTWKQWYSHLASKLNASFEGITQPTRAFGTWFFHTNVIRDKETEALIASPPAWLQITLAKKKHQEWFYSHWLSEALATRKHRGTHTVQQATGRRIMSIW